MADLYDTLGVAKDASKAEIKSAFRKLAKTAHPDVGGDAAAFHQIERAHRILSDDERRAHYDETGDTDTQPDNSENEAVAVIAAVVDRFLNDDNAKYKNLVAEIRRLVKEDIALAKRNVDEGRRYELKTIDLQKRVKGKGGALLVSMFEHKLRDCRNAITQLEKQIAIRERALELVEDADFDAEKMTQQDVFAQDTINRMYRNAFVDWGSSAT